MKRRSIRLDEYDYSEPGAYFITICTYKKRPLFGKNVDGIVRLSDVGKIVEGLWREIPNHFKNTEIEKYVIMTDHLHGIIVIKEIEREIFSNATGVIVNDGRGTVTPALAAGARVPCPYKRIERFFRLDWFQFRCGMPCPYRRWQGFSLGAVSKTCTRLHPNHYSLIQIRGFKRISQTLSKSTALAARVLRARDPQR